MRNETRNPGPQDSVSPPGETLKETLDSLGMSQVELAERMGRPKKTINEIIKGKAALTPDTALQLERVLGISAGFWSNRDFHYREFLAKRQEAERLSHNLGWLDEMPVREMVKLGWIKTQPDKIQQMQEVLNFFGVATPECWKKLWYGPKIAFRKSQAFRNDPGLLAGWLRTGELLARGLACAPFRASRFEDFLSEARALNAKDPGCYRQQLIRGCAEAGVALIFLPEPPRLSISGATRWLTSTKALMQISLRYTTDDQFWLTFFHEAGHILLHGKRDIFVESNGHSRTKEEDADNFAFQWLLPKESMDRFLAEGPPSRESIGAFAATLALAPGVVVGLMQHRGVLPNFQFNDMKRLFKLESE